MADDVYKKLREQLDQYSIGFPETKSGVEMKILKKLFQPDEAAFYLDLTMLLETPESIAQRTNGDEKEVAAMLERMAEKGLIFRLRKGDAVKYAASPFVVGAYEFQLKDMDAELARLIEDFMEEAFLGNFSAGDMIMRPIPVNRAVEVAHQVAPYEDVRQILEKQRLITVADCICRKQQGLLEKGCDKPKEVCFTFGSHAEYYLSRGMARQVTLDEALRILDKAEEAGLVPQPYNTVNPGGFCNCCGDCCGILRSLKKLPRPVDIVVSNYYAVVDEDACTGCEICLDRCQMDAIAMNDDGIAVVDLDRCIGCGLCVTTCSGEALRLDKKAEPDQKTPPQTAYEQMSQVAEARGKSLIPLKMQPKA